MMARLPRLALVAVSRGGPVNIDMAAARARKIRVVNVPGRNASAVAEFTIGAILSETRLIRAGHEALRRGDWRGDLYRADRTGRELNEMTVGVIGYGNIGTRVVTLLRAFGCRILVADPYVQLKPEDAAAGVTQVTLEDLLEESDLVTLHARVTEETTGFIDAAAFARMRPGAVFVNTARGPMVDYDALYEALASGHLGGAMLETFAVEPPPEDWPAAAPAQRHPDPAHRRRLAAHRDLRRRAGGRGGAPIHRRRVALEPLLREGQAAMAQTAVTVAWLFGSPRPSGGEGGSAAARADG